MVNKLELPAFPSTALLNVKLHIPKAQKQEPPNVISLNNLHHYLKRQQFSITLRFLHVLEARPRTKNTYGTKRYIPVRSVPIPKKETAR